MKLCSFKMCIDTSEEPTASIFRTEKCWTKLCSIPSLGTKILRSLYFWDIAYSVTWYWVLQHHVGASSSGLRYSSDIWHVALEDETTIQTWMLETVTLWWSAASRKKKGVDCTTSKLWTLDHSLVLTVVRTWGPITVWSCLLRSNPCGVSCTAVMNDTCLMFVFVFFVSALNV